MKMKACLIILMFFTSQIIFANNFCSTKFGTKILNQTRRNAASNKKIKKLFLPPAEKKPMFSANVVVELKRCRNLKLKKKLLSLSKFSETKFKNKNFENVYLAASQIVSKKSEKKLFKTLVENGAKNILSFTENYDSSNYSYYDFCFDDFLIIQTENTAQAATLAKKLIKLKFVKNAVVSHLYYTSLWEPNDDYFSSTGAWGQTYNNLWGLQTNKMNAPAAWEKSKGENIIVAVLDTGVDINHPDISDNIWTNPGEIPGNNKDDDHNGFVDDVHGWRFSDRLAKYSQTPGSSPDVADTDGHGTHIAGTIAATTDNSIGISGVAPAAKIMPVCVLPGGGGTDFDIAKGIIYAVKNGAKVLNMSFGSGSRGSPILRRAIKYAIKQGVVPVAAVGNENSYLSSYPAANKGVIAVAASDQNDNRTFFSNYGFGIDVAAPGGGTNNNDNYNILSLYSTEATSRTSEFSYLKDFVVDDNYLRLAGTSMACPQVSGAVALLLALHPDWTAEEVRAALRKTADNKANDWSNEIGYGRINLDNLTKVSKKGKAWLNGLRNGYRELISLSRLPAKIKFTGTATADDFQNYKIEEGIGISPTNWTLVHTGTKPKKKGKLAPPLKIESMEKSEVRCYRLTVFGANNTKFESRLWVEYNPLPHSFGKTKTNKIKTKRLPDFNACIACDSKDNAYYIGYNATIGYNKVESILQWRKYSSKGKLISKKRLFKDKILVPTSAVIDKQENLIIVGSAYDPKVENKKTIFVAKLDSEGNPLWIKLDSEVGEIFSSFSMEIIPVLVCIDNANNIIVSSPISTIGFPNWEFLMAKYDADGNRIWEHYQKIGMSAAPVALIVDSENNIYSAGYCSTNKHTEMFISKHNSAGTSLWTYIPGTNMIPYGMSLLPNSEFLIIGGTDVAQYGLVLPPFKGNFSFAAKFNKNGEIISANNLALSENMWPTSNSLILKDGSIIISGEYARKYQKSGLFCSHLSQDGEMLKLDVYTMKKKSELYLEYIASNSKGDIWMSLSDDNLNEFQARLPEFVDE